MESEGLPTAQQRGSQLAKQLLAQTTDFKKSDCCRAALHTCSLKTRPYQPRCTVPYQLATIWAARSARKPSSPVSSKGFSCLRLSHTGSSQAQTPSAFTWRQKRFGMGITRLLYFSLLSCWNSWSVPPFVWPTLTSLHHSTGFVVPDSLLQGTMWEAQQPVPRSRYSTTQIALPISHQEIQSTSTKTQKPQKDQQWRTEAITNTQDCCEGIYCLKLPRLCSMSASKMMILPLPTPRTVYSHSLFHKAWAGSTHRDVKGKC